jgi:hypothetical protein
MLEVPSEHYVNAVIRSAGDMKVFHRSISGSLQQRMSYPSLNLVNSQVRKFVRSTCILFLTLGKSLRIVFQIISKSIENKRERLGYASRPSLAKELPGDYP